MNGLAVVSTATRKLEFKVKFIYAMNLKMTSSGGIIAVPRIRNGVLIEFGTSASRALPPSGGRATPRQQAPKQSQLPLRTMNDVRSKFEETYGAKIEGSYLCIDESIVNWDSRHKLLPICVRFRDYLYADAKDGERVLRYYEEMTMLTLTYNNQFTIWEALIRQGLLHGRVEINDGQLQRLTNPVLSDNNENLIHKLSRHHLPHLTKVFQGTSIGETRNDANKRYPIFLNFDGKSQLDLALEDSDFDSFQFLLAQAINIQQGFESAYLVDSWLLKAIKLELDLKLLFESKLCT